MVRRWPKPLMLEGIWTIVFTTINAEPTLWDAILPEAALRLPPGLVEIDRLLDDPRFFEPFREFFDPRQGRPSIPMETYLRMMFLRFRYKLGFETLCAEVSDSIAWRRFCRIPLDTQVPHPTTLLKITSRCGAGVVEQLNEALLAKAAEEKLVRLDRVRADSTVVEANVAYPTDSGLLAKVVVSLVGLVMVLKAAGLARRTRFRDRRRSVRRRAHEVAVWLRRRNDDAKDEVLAITGELARLAELTVAEARAVAVNARRALARGSVEPTSGGVRRALAEIDRITGLAEQIVAQTRTRLAGEIPDGASRVVSLHDPDARPIRKGRLGRPVEFGYKAQVADNADGLVLHHEVVVGNPADAPMLAPAIARIKARFGRTPKTVTADRGYGEASVDKALEKLGVTFVAIPRRGRPGPQRTTIQRARRFVRLVKWRTGSEARINCLKRDWGWRRTLLDGHAGVQIWCGRGVLAHNATKITTLPTARTVTKPAENRRPDRPRHHRGTDPPTPPDASAVA
jgi:transposase, IS5 family